MWPIKSYIFCEKSIWGNGFATLFTHITPLLRDLHWLHVPECVKFRLCVLAYRCLHGMALSYLTDDLQLTSTVGTRRQLWSADSPTLVVRSTRRSMLGDRAFPVAAARAWNSLPPAVRDAPSLLSFRSRLKTWLFELTLAWQWLHSLAALHFVCDFSNSV